MRSMKLTLITGRTTRQGIGISTGKERSEYQEATGVIDLNQTDMAKSSLGDGDSVCLKTEFGTAEVRCREADIPEGIAFMAFGPSCNRLVGGETHASGMPDSKHLIVELRPMTRKHTNNTKQDV
jgi:formylmethanofuran dehydrogenase subunit D